MNPSQSFSASPPSTHALTFLGLKPTHWAWLCAAMAVAVCVLAFHPNPPEQADFGHDKINHFIAFAALAFTAALGWQRWAEPSAFGLGLRQVVVVALAGVAFGGFVELVQTQIPNRSGEWADLLADAVGIVIGLALASSVRVVQRARLKSPQA